LALHARIRGLLKSIDRYYRYSSLRNAILAVRAKRHGPQILSLNRRFVVFLVPGFNIVNGGQISICSIASETKRLVDTNGIPVYLCTPPCEPRILQYTKFDCNFHIFAFDDLVPQLPSGSEVLVHVPEMSVQKYVAACEFGFRSRPDLKWRFNILLQNIDLIPPKEAVTHLKNIGPTTATIAHKAYATIETAQRLGCPIHYLSWWVCPEKFERVGYFEKEKLIVISPDEHPAKREILHRISRALPDHKILEIRNMTYQRFKRSIKHAKFSFTFGEGLDGYFIEEIFSGGVGMAIFNDRFFTSKYRSLEGVFCNGDDAIKNIIGFLKVASDDIGAYQAIAEKQYNFLATDFVKEEYVQNISDFYDKYYPEWRSPNPAGSANA
jgi:hypothetical protein